mgnify:CR=1 FL=1
MLWTVVAIILGGGDRGVRPKASLRNSKSFECDAPEERSSSTARCAGRPVAQRAFEHRQMRSRMLPKERRSSTVRCAVRAKASLRNSKSFKCDWPKGRNSSTAGAQGETPSPHKLDPGSLPVAKSGRFSWKILAETVHYFEVPLFLSPRQKILL